MATTENSILWKNILKTIASVAYLRYLFLGSMYALKVKHVANP